MSSHCRVTRTVYPQASLRAELRKSLVDLRKLRTQFSDALIRRNVHCARDVDTGAGGLSCHVDLVCRITAKRCELIERLQTTGPTTLRGLARKLDRDVKRVHEDVRMLIKHGLVVRTADRTICVPYDVIHADFDLRAVV
jgi:hypothetical protein